LPTDNRQVGGHVPDFTLDEGTLELAVCSRIDLRLPTVAGARKEGGIEQGGKVKADATP